MGITTANENWELDGHPLPNDCEVNDKNQLLASKGSSVQFKNRGIHEDMAVHTDIVLREGNRISAILYEKEDTWITHMIRPIQVGVLSFGPLHEISSEDIIGDTENVNRIVKFDATLTTDDGELVFSNVDVRSVERYNLF